MTKRSQAIRTANSTPDRDLRSKLDHLTLSRKEGFKRMAETPARPQPELLTRSQLSKLGDDALEEYNKTRRKHHANLGPLQTPQMTALHEDLWDIVDSNEQDGDKTKGGIAVDAFPGLGKTTAVLAFARKFHRREIKEKGAVTDDGHERWPACRVGLTSNTSMRDFNRAILEFYGHPGRFRGTATDFGFRALDCVLSCEARILIVDDLHFLAWRNKNGIEVSNHFKYIANEFPITLVMIGVGLEICRVTGAPRGTGYKAHIARAYLFQRLSMLPCDTPPAGVSATPSEFRAALALFPTRLFPELRAQLDKAAQRFLAVQGIPGEPVIWQPGLDLILDLDLPGPDPVSIPIAELHQLLHEGNSPVKAARALDTTADAVRAVLAEHPAPARRISRGQGRLPGPRTRAAEIPKEEFEQLYLRERLSTRQIAARYHVQKGTVADLLRGHGIPLGWRPPAGVTPDWLQEEYVEKGRTFNDLAAEVGMSPVAVANWAKKWGLPVRPRGNQPSTHGRSSR